MDKLYFIQIDYWIGDSPTTYHYQAVRRLNLEAEGLDKICERTLKDKGASSYKVNSLNPV